jgi:hypothetical protein
MAMPSLWDQITHIAYEMSCKSIQIVEESLRCCNLELQTISDTRIGYLSNRVNRVRIICPSE